MNPDTAKLRAEIKAANKKGYAEFCQEEDKKLEQFRAELKDRYRKELEVHIAERHENVRQYLQQNRIANFEKVQNVKKKGGRKD